MTCCFPHYATDGVCHGHVVQEVAKSAYVPQTLCAPGDAGRYYEEAENAYVLTTYQEPMWLELPSIQYREGFR